MFSQFRMYTRFAIRQLTLISDKQYTRARDYRAPFLLLCDWRGRYGEDHRNTTQNVWDTTHLATISPHGAKTPSSFHRKISIPGHKGQRIFHNADVIH